MIWRSRAVAAAARRPAIVRRRRGIESRAAQSCAVAALGLAAIGVAGCGSGSRSLRPAVPRSGVIWVDHTGVRASVPNWGQLITTTNGTDVFFQPRNSVMQFPVGAVPLQNVPIQSIPGLYVTGAIACVAAQGSSPDTGLLRLRLAQFDAPLRGYVVKHEAPVSGPPVGPPDAPGSFACVETGAVVCLDPGDGTISIDLSVQVGAAADAVRLRALGAMYDTECGRRRR